MKPPTIDHLERLIADAMRADDWALVAELEPRLDAAQKAAQKAVTCLTAALWYAGLGILVFPLHPQAKEPYTRNGFKDASNDVDKINNWWRRWPNANLGIATGHLIDIIDIDGPTGVKTWADTADDFPPIIATATTPRYDTKKQAPKQPPGGGNHLYIHATGQPRRTAFLPGIDYLGTGGYAVAVPSIMPNGSTYHWRTPLRAEALQEKAA